jgi:hypothetical protein
MPAPCPFSRFVAISSFLLANACGASVTSPPEDLPVTRVTQAVFGGFSTPERLVVTSQPQLQEAWAAMFARISHPPEVPAVDFSSEFVIIASSGTKPSTGYNIFVDAAVATTRNVTVTVRSVSPGPNCGNATVITTPTDIVRIPLRSRTVDFVEKSEVADCR